MRFLRSALLALLAFVLSLIAPLCASAQNYTTSITLSHLLTSQNLSSQGPTPYATICAIPSDVYGTPIAVSAPTWGFIAKGTKFCGSVVSGALSSGINVPDAAHTNASTPIFYNITIQPTIAGGIANGEPTQLTAVPNITSTSYDLDTYAPTITGSITPSGALVSSPSIPSACTSPSLLIRSTDGSLWSCNTGTYSPAAAAANVTAASILAAGQLSNNTSGYSGGNTVTGTNNCTQIPQSGFITCDLRNQTQSALPSTGTVTNGDYVLNNYGYQGDNWGNPGGWTSSTNLHLATNTNIRGIKEGINEALTSHADGDTIGGYIYTYADCGFVDQSGEGCKGLGIAMSQNLGFYIGTYTRATVTGPTSPALSAATSGNNWLTDGTYLIDETTNVLAYEQNGASAPVTSTQIGTSGTYLAHQIPVLSSTGGAAHVPLSTTYGTAFATGTNVISNLAPPLPNTVSVAVTVQPIGGIYNAFANGHACIEGHWFTEQTTLTVGTMNPTTHVQTVTMPVRNPEDSLVLWQGGLCGNSQVTWNYDIDYAYTGAQQLFQAFGSLDGASIVYGFEVGGFNNNYANMPVGGMSIATSTPGNVTFNVPNLGGQPTGTTTTVNSSALHVYESSEIINAGAFSTPTSEALEPNVMVLNSGDVMADPHSASLQIAGANVGIGAAVPCNPSVECDALRVSAGGNGFVGASNSGPSLLNFTNSNPPSFYKEGGGQEQVPDLAIINGPYRSMFNSFFTPGIGGRVFSFLSPPASTTLEPTFCFLCFDYSNMNAASIVADLVNYKLIFNGANLPSPIVTNGTLTNTTAHGLIVGSGPTPDGFSDSEIEMSNSSTGNSPVVVTMERAQNNAYVGENYMTGNNYSAGWAAGLVPGSADYMIRDFTGANALDCQPGTANPCTSSKPFVAPSIAAAGTTFTGTTAAASNCNGGGAITGVAGCLVITIGGDTHYTPYF